MLWEKQAERMQGCSAGSFREEARETAELRMNRTAEDRKKSGNEGSDRGEGRDEAHAQAVQDAENQNETKKKEILSETTKQTNKRAHKGEGENHKNVNIKQMLFTLILQVGADDLS